MIVFINSLPAQSGKGTVIGKYIVSPVQLRIGLMLIYPDLPLTMSCRGFMVSVPVSGLMSGPGLSSGCQDTALCSKARQFTLTVRASLRSSV